MPQKEEDIEQIEGETKVEVNQETRTIEFKFTAQFAAVWKKSLINQWRQRKTNICQVSFPLLLLIVLFLLQLLVTSIIQQLRGQYTEADTRPQILPNNLYLPYENLECEASGLELEDKEGRFLYISSDNTTEIGLYGGVPKDSFTNAFLGEDFVEPNNNGTKSGLLGNATTPLTNLIAYQSSVNVGRGGANFANICFQSPKLLYPILYQNNSKEDVDTTIFNAWRNKIFVGGFDLSRLSIVDGKLDIGIFYNKTLTGGRDLPLLINFLTNALWRTLVTPAVQSQLTFAGTKDVPSQRVVNDFDLISLIGPQLYIYIFQLLFPVMLQGLVFEKENRLREIMKMMGLKTYVYWLVTYIFYFLLYFIAAGLCVIIALAMGFRYFLQNSFLSYFALLFTWGHTMVASAFFLSVFFTKTRTSTVVGYSYVLAIGLFAPNLIQQYFTSDETPPSTVFGLTCFPPFALYRGLIFLSRAVTFGGPGIASNQLEDPNYQIATVCYFLVVEWAILMVLAVYFENVLPIGPGVKRHPLFFLPKRIWYRKQVEIESIDKDEDEPDDVRKERERVEKPDCNSAIRVLAINKVFPPRSGMPPKVAVHELTMGIEYGECFGFLGPNGAGKSTTINMLCGYLRPTHGTAIINGLNIKDDIDEIHLQMGVCNQEDILWEDLTGAEHLEFYGRLKNLHGKELEEQIEYWLRQVNLHSKKTKAKFAREYSGGMKRRLSVALALIGNSRVVLLDEPTTGLDPASRKQLWSVINNYKKKCCMLLTTHSMEEAEGLCDKLGIFVGGRLKTIGASAELKNRYGQFYKIIITSKMTYEEKARRFLESIAPGVRLINSLAGTATYEVDKKNIKLSQLFKAIESKKEKLRIKDWGASNTTLEEVFLRITLKEAKDEADVIGSKQRGCCGRKPKKAKGVKDEELPVIEEKDSSSSDKV